MKEIGSPASRMEILDWYHLRENLYKVGGSLKRLKQAEAQLWLLSSGGSGLRFAAYAPC